MSDRRTIRRALLSVSDKRGLADLAAALVAHDIEIISTGGTARALREAGFAVRDVAEITEFPEMMNGRVKTLHPRVHGALLAERDHAEHRAAMQAHNIAPIDLLVVTLYPFASVAMSGAERAEIIENIDIGGPAMIRSAAKNHADVTVVTSPDDYPSLIENLRKNGGKTDLAYRKRMAARAFAHTATYDSMIAQWFAFADQKEQFPETLPLTAHRSAHLRYGENPHQNAALYIGAGPQARGIPQAKQVQGKDLSYNNINDADSALALISSFRDGAPSCAIIKHANPCGVACAASLAEAYRAAYECDSISAFGGVVALNRPLDADTAREITKIFTEVIIAPDVDEEARAVVAEKKNLRLLLTGELPDPHRGGLMMKNIAGGWLVQNRDNGSLKDDELRVVTKRAPSESERADALFAWAVARHVASNAIVYAKDQATAGIGAGQMNRRDSAHIAAQKAAEAAQIFGWDSPRTHGSAVASDAFFPFADGLEAAIAAGATCVIQPGGSVRDAEVIAAADKADIAMIFTGMRHFRH